MLEKTPFWSRYDARHFLKTSFSIERLSETPSEKST
jgi:hypothetical protein